MESLELDEPAVLAVLHEVASARRTAMLELTDNGFLEKEKVRPPIATHRHPSPPIATHRLPSPPIATQMDRHGAQCARMNPNELSLPCN